MSTALAGLVLLLAPLLGGPDGPDVSWRLELALHPEPRVHVRLVARGEADGSSVLALTQGWGGVDAAGEDVAELGVTGEDGTPLDVRRTQPWRWEVGHEPGERLTVDYTLRANAHQDDPSPRGHYRPVLNERLLHLIGELGLVRPQHLDDATPRRVRLEWVGFQEAGWELACSFGTGWDPIEVELPLRAVRQGLYLAGEVEVLRRDVRGSSVVVAVATPEEGFDPELFADLVGRVVELERDFFDDFDQAPYLVTHLPVGVPDSRSLSLGGTGLQRAFASFTQRGERLEPGSRLYLPVIRLLLHEMFHEWNGHVLSRVAPEELLYWFSEGFTSFYTRRLAYRGGWIDAAGYADDLGEVLREHATSGVRHATAEQVRQGFWTDRDLQRLPYLRGDLLACLLDHAIRVRSGGERSLDDFLRALVEEAYAKPARRIDLDTAGLLERVEDWAGAEAAGLVRAVAVGGAPLELPVDCFAPALVLEPAELALYELGFDLERTRAENVLRGVVPGSAAEQAGLREGERLAGLSVRPGRSDVPVELRVGAAGSERTVTFLPRGDVLPGQAVRVVDAAAGPGLL